MFMSIYHYRYALWYGKIDIVKEIPPALYKMETNYIDFRGIFPEQAVVGNFYKSPNGVVIKYPGAQVKYYLYEARSQWAHISLLNESKSTVSLSLWLNNHLVDVVSVQEGQNEIKIFMQEHFVVTGQNHLYFILGEERKTGFVLSDIYFSAFPTGYKIITEHTSTDPSTLWLAGRGEVIYYVDMPEDSYLNYAVNYAIASPKNKEYSGKIKVKLKSDSGQIEFLDAITLSSKNNDKWMRYVHKLEQFSKRKAKLAFTFYFDDINLFGKISFRLKAEVRGKIRMIQEKKAAIPPRKSFNVMLIILDAASAGHMSIYGYPVQTTPSLEKFAEKSLLFTRAYTTAVFTRGSTSSLFTSLYANTHNVIDYLHSLPKGIPTLAEVFKENDYKTVMFTTNGNVSDQTGLAQGFDEYYPLFRQFPEDLTKNIKEWLNKQKSKNFFLYAHYRHPHPPYDAPFALRNQFNKTQLATLEFNDPLIDKIYTGELFPSAEQRNYVISQYDANIYYVDRSINEIISYIFSSELQNNTIVIITADHGEAMGEHRVFGHAWDLHTESIWIPLLIYHPLYRKRQAVSGVIDNVDIMPTLITLLNLKNKPSIMQGKSFSECFADSSCVTKGEAYIQSLSERIFSIIDEQHQMIFDCKANKWFLYDLHNDKDARYNIIDTYPITSEYYKDKIMRFIRINNSMNRALSRGWKGQEFKPSGEVLENLKALGYVQ